MKFLQIVSLFFFPFALSAQNYYGGNPALFDDFSYTSTEFPVQGDSSGSLFGKNIWYTENGTISSKAWHRYNWGDPNNFGKNSGVSPTKNGVTLYAQKGFRFGDITPSFMSGFILKEGTYISRVRMSALPVNTNSIQAFWLMSPDHYRFKTGQDSTIHYTEIDFEWNNWFAGRGKHRMHTTNVGALHSKKGLITNGQEVRFFQQSGDVLTKLHAEVDESDEFYFENRWYYYLIKIDSVRQITEYYMESAEEDNSSMEKVFGGSNRSGYDSVMPISIQEFYPKSPLNVIYNFSSGSLIQDSLLQSDMTMDVDWFYFTTQTNVNIQEVLNEITHYRSHNISRANTLGIAMNYNISQPHTAFILGPDTIKSGSTAQWTVQPSLKNTLYDIEFSYTFKNASNINNQVYAEDRTITLTPESDTQEIEIKAIVKNFWTNEIITITKLVIIEPK